jgi:hypothetical protein
MYVFNQEVMPIVYYVVYESEKGENILGNFMSKQSAEEFVSTIRHWFVTPLHILPSTDLLSRNT